MGLLGFSGESLSSDNLPASARCRAGHARPDPSCRRMVEHVVPPGEVFPNEGAPRGIHYWPKLQRMRCEAAAGAIVPLPARAEGETHRRACSYVVCPTYWPSVGQYIAEAAMYARNLA